MTMVMKETEQKKKRKVWDRAWPVARKLLVPAFEEDAEEEEEED